MAESRQRAKPAKALMAPEVQRNSRNKRNRSLFIAELASSNRSSGRSQQTLPSIIVCLIILTIVEQELPAVTCKSLWGPVGEQSSSPLPTASLAIAGLLGEDGPATGSILWRPMMDYAASVNKSPPQPTSPLANLNEQRQLLLANENIDCGKHRFPAASPTIKAAANANEQTGVVAAASAMSEVRAPNLRARQPMRPRKQSGQRRRQQRDELADVDVDADMDGSPFDDDDDADEPKAHARPLPQLTGADSARGPGGRGNQIRGNESMLLGSSVAAPSSPDHRRPDPRFVATEARRRQQMQFQSGKSQSPENDEMAEDERRANEASDEATSEAEAADRSALDEQRQQQREIILAQAQSEAKAIREQQEALLRQQLALQQILLSRQREASAAAAADSASASGGAGNQRTSPSARREHQHHHSRQQRHRPGNHQGGANQHQANQRGRAVAAARGREHERFLQLQSATSSQADGGDSSRENGDAIFGRPLDTQFSDQPDGNDISTGDGKRARLHSSNRQATTRDDHESAGRQSGYLGEEGPNGEDELSTGSGASPHQGRAGEADEVAASDLVVAAQQHHYGGYAGNGGGGHKGDYYQYAESHEKGQFDSGFKRGGKKFQISGNSSQNKGHAEGHVKWHGKKSKGTQYWNLQHKDKKPHYGTSYDHSSYDGQHYY